MRTELISLLNFYDQCALECDGIIGVHHTVLEQQEIPHSVCVGTVASANRKCICSALLANCKGYIRGFPRPDVAGNNPDSPHGNFTFDEIP